VLEWGSGQSLQTAAATPTFDLDRTLGIARVCVFQLTKVHSVGLVHCDLKPPNIFAEEDPTLGMRFRLKISDFDCALMDSEPCPQPGAAFLGTSVGYSSPEHLRGQKPTQRSDVFTMGVILFELLMGQHPHLPLVEGGSDHEINTQIHNGLKKRWLPQFDQVDTDRSRAIPKHIKEAILTCLSYDERSRPTARELHALLIQTGRVQIVLSPESSPLKSRFKEAVTLQPAFCHRMFGVPKQLLEHPPFRVEPSADGKAWFIRPIEGTPYRIYVNRTEVVRMHDIPAGAKIEVTPADASTRVISLHAEFENLV
jgi:serine/threonine protein kinase